MPLEGKRCFGITTKPRFVGPQTFSLLYSIQIPTPLPAFRLFSSGDGKSSRILVPKPFFLHVRRSKTRGPRGLISLHEFQLLFVQVFQL